MKKPKAKKSKKKTANPDQGLAYTLSGEWFPETYPVLRSKKWTRGDEDLLRTEIRLFGAAERWAFRGRQIQSERSESLVRGRPAAQKLTVVRYCQLF